MNPPKLTFPEFAAKYCERQQQSFAGLRAIFTRQKELYSPDGWMLLECHMLDSSRIGQFTILPYGGTATYKEVPDRPISPRGLASDMSVVVALLPVENFV